MLMLDTKNLAANPVELKLTDIPSDFKFTPMGLGTVYFQLIIFSI